VRYSESYVSPHCEKQTHYTNYDRAEEVSATEGSGYRSRYPQTSYARTTTYRPAAHITPLVSQSLTNLHPQSDLPSCIELSPNKYSPERSSLKYYPIRHPAHNQVDWDTIEAKRRAAEEESRRIEGEQRQRWAEEDAEREARRQAIEEDHLRWEEDQRARRDLEDLDREARNEAERQRIERERAEREKEERDRRALYQKEQEQRERELEERKRQTDEMLKRKIKQDLQDAEEFKKMMPQSYEAPLPDVREVKQEPRTAKKKTRRKKSHLRRKPDHPVEVYNMDQDPTQINPRYEQIGHALFKGQKYQPPNIKKVRAKSAKPLPKPNNGLSRITEEEYLKTLYPDIDYTAGDVHCYREHNHGWFGEFMQKVFDKSNEVKYDIFMQRCLKTSPYNDNGGEKFAMLKSLAKYRSSSPKKNYERNTISFLAKGI